MQEGGAVPGGRPSAGVEGGRVRRWAGRGARNQGFLGPSAAPPSGGECGCARRVPVSGERRAGRGPRERASKQAAEQQPGWKQRRGGCGRSAPCLPGLPGLAAPGPATPAYGARPLQPPSPWPAVPPVCPKQGAERGAQRNRSQSPPAPQTKPSRENPRPAQRCSTNGPGAVPSAPLQKPASELSPAEP
ncbi:predicted GPI-anchored protein 58 [Sciurus carolinensis]|uniref:predicted GPI-anchored protein 58 n=1 Tax=Sciurus carolinensis TaxID=30640 RepID=UPI001FB5123F|nr:predicted GPI-anchored protein 58 [Sciurus carolinensis]